VQAESVRFEGLNPAYGPACEAFGALRSVIDVDRDRLVERSHEYFEGRSDELTPVSASDQREATTSVDGLSGRKQMHPVRGLGIEVG
jgi:hypothetical protein